MEDQAVIKINKGNKVYSLSKNMFGVLETDKNNPLSCVSVSNNSLSIDYFSDEGEFLLKRGTGFKVLKKEKTEGILNLVLEVIDGR